MRESDGETSGAVQRLCGEIQLFDLCDLSRCDYKAGRFCTNTDLLARFERISEDDRQPAVRAVTDGEDGEELEAGFYDDDLDAESFDDDQDDWEKE